MTYDEIISEFEKLKDERGIANFNRLMKSDLKTYGIGLTKIKALAKKLKKDTELADKLYSSDIYEAQLLAPLIDDPKRYTFQQLAGKTKNNAVHFMYDTFTQYISAKSKFNLDIISNWRLDEDYKLRRAAFSVCYYVASKNKKLPDTFFIPLIEQIEETIHEEENSVKDGMLGALFSIGKRNKALNARTLQAVKSIGYVDVDYGDTSCKPIDLNKHLESPALKEKLGIK